MRPAIPITHTQLAITGGMSRWQRTLRYGRKLAVTVLAAFIATVQVEPETASQPLQLKKMPGKAGVAVRVTTERLSKSAVQVDPQSIPVGLDVTVPPRMPVFVTVSGTVMVKLLVLTADPPGVVTLIGPVAAPVGTVA